MTRDQLIDALANIEVRDVKVTGPDAGLLVADDLADAILSQIPGETASGAGAANPAGVPGCVRVLAGASKEDLRGALVLIWRLKPAYGPHGDEAPF